MRRLWTEGRATFDGEHYQVDGAICRPLPLQDGGLLLWVAGGGERKTLRIAAKYAHYTNFEGILGIFRRKSEILAQHYLDLGTTSMRSPGRPMTTSSSARPRPTWTPSSPG